MSAESAVGIHHQFPARETCVRSGTALHESAGGIDEDFRVRIEGELLKHGMQHLGDDLVLQHIEVFVLAVLN